MEVRDGANNSAPLLGRYCGSTRPPPIYAASGSLQVTFKSDDTQVYKGFLAHFSDSATPMGKIKYTYIFIYLFIDSFHVQCGNKKSKLIT